MASKFSIELLSLSLSDSNVWLFCWDLDGFFSSNALLKITSSISSFDFLLSSFSKELSSELVDFDISMVIEDGNDWFVLDGDMSLRGSLISNWFLIS